MIANDGDHRKRSQRVNIYPEGVATCMLACRLQYSPRARFFFPIIFAYINASYLTTAKRPPEAIGTTIPFDLSRQFPQTALDF